MSDTPQEVKVEKEGLHSRNKHQGKYDFQALTKVSPELKSFVTMNKVGVESIAFADPKAVKALNGALLKLYYNISSWDIPEGYLCPPVPGRADYIHHVADLLANENRQVVPKGQTVKVLDIGTGANLIYPIIGNAEYGWTFVGSDVDKKALKSAGKILDANPELKEHVTLRQQTDPMQILNNIIQPDEEFDLMICNPPFHSTNDEALEATQRKWKNLGKPQAAQGVKNFGGQNAELFFPGGEQAFISKMIAESKKYGQQVHWFTSLVSRADHLRNIHKVLKKFEVAHSHTIHMSQGQKMSRVICWTYLDESKRREWRERKFWD
jgi:23S rRNA (adenine1618-N6)-methyltransferase